MNKFNFQFINFLLTLSKIISGFFIGFTIAVIAKGFLNLGTLSFVFLTITVGMAYLKLIWFYRWIGLIACNLFFIALFLFLKLYITMSVS